MKWFCGEHKNKQKKTKQVISISSVCWCFKCSGLVSNRGYLCNKSAQIWNLNLQEQKAFPRNETRAGFVCCVRETAGWTRNHSGSWRSSDRAWVLCYASWYLVKHALPMALSGTQGTLCYSEWVSKFSFGLCNQMPMIIEWLFGFLLRCLCGRSGVCW